MKIEIKERQEPNAFRITISWREIFQGMFSGHSMQDLNNESMEMVESVQFS